MFSEAGPESMRFFKYLTFVTLYDVESILSGGSGWVLKLCVLAGIASVTFVLGAVTFTKRDLPL